MKETSQKYISLFLRFLISGTFIYSAYTKYISIDSFELFIYKFSFFSWELSTIASRIILSIELFIGLFIILNIYTIKLVRSTIGLLAAFCIYLLYMYFFESEAVNCNCFGEEIELTPLESIVKNLILIIFAVILLFIQREWQFKFRRWVLVAIVLLSLSLPSILSPPDAFLQNKYAYTAKKEKDPNKFLNDTIINNFKYDGKQYDITKGKTILCFFSMKCHFCTLSAKKLTIINEKNDNKIPIYYYFFGEESDLELFWDKSESNKVPYQIISFKELLQLGGKNLPAMYLLDDGVVKEYFGYRHISEKKINTFFQ